MKLLKDLGRAYPKENSKQKKLYGLYECPRCHKPFKAMTNNVKSGTTTKCKSCGSANNTNGLIHGNSYNPLLNIWRAMRERCYNPESKSYRNYGAKGVTICKEWRENAQAFIDWSLLNGYSDGLQCDKDKICNEKGIYPKIYSPETCTWMTRDENMALKTIGIDLNSKLSTNNFDTDKHPSEKQN